MWWFLLFFKRTEGAAPASTFCQLILTWILAPVPLPWDLWIREIFYTFMRLSQFSWSLDADLGLGPWDHQGRYHGFDFFFFTQSCYNKVESIQIIYVKYLAWCLAHNKYLLIAVGGDTWIKLLLLLCYYYCYLDRLPSWHSGKKSAWQCRGHSLIPGSKRSPGGGHGDPFQ